MENNKKFNLGDIDLDVNNRYALLDILKHIPASNIKDGQLIPHPTGIYVQEIPKDPITGLASIPFERAEKLGYFKIDVLNMSAYKNVRNEEHLLELLNKPVNWEIFKDRDIVKKLHHIHNYSDLVAKMSPQNIEHLAMILAIIRPGKKHLQYKPWKEVENSVWEKDVDGYVFKRSHATAYAASIIVQLNSMIEEGEIN